jgi:hypothetical protein
MLVFESVKWELISTYNGSKQRWVTFGKDPRLAVGRSSRADAPQT